MESSIVVDCLYPLRFFEGHEKVFIFGEIGFFEEEYLGNTESFHILDKLHPFGVAHSITPYPIRSDVFFHDPALSAYALGIDITDFHIITLEYLYRSKKSLCRIGDDFAYKTESYVLMPGEREDLITLCGLLFVLVCTVGRTTLCKLISQIIPFFGIISHEELSRETSEHRRSREDRKHEENACYGFRIASDDKRMSEDIPNSVASEIRVDDEQYS